MTDTACDWPNRCLEFANPDEQDHPFDAVLCPAHIDEAWMEYEAENQGDAMREQA